MADKYIYFVGKPYPHPEAIQIIRQKGYGVGVLLDKNVSLKHHEQYDRVDEVDFTSVDTLLASIKTVDLRAAGLVCTYENYIVAKAQLGEYLKLAAQSITSAEMCTDKFLMRQAFTSYDKSITPQFRLVSSEKEIGQLSRELSFPLILKPTNLVKSLLVLKCNDAQELMENFRYAQAKIAGLYERYNIHGRRPQIIVEEFVEGNLCSVAAFVDTDGIPHVCDGVAGLVNAHDVGLQDNFLYARYLPADIPETLKPRLFEVARKGIAALQMTSTPAHVELIYNDHEVKLVEIGARIGGYRPRMYAQSYGIDLLEQEINLAIGMQPKFDDKFRAYTAVFELFPEREGPFDEITGELSADKFAYYAVKAKPGKMIGPAKAGYKAAAIIIVAENDKIRFDELCRQVGSLRVVTR